MMYSSKEIANKFRKERAIERIQNITLESKDFSINENDAIIYGIFAGWDDESFKELKQIHNWSDRDIMDIMKLRISYRQILAEN